MHFRDLRFDTALTFDEVMSEVIDEVVDNDEKTKRFLEEWIYPDFEEEILEWAKERLEEEQAE